MKELLLSWLFKGLEIVLVWFLGGLVYAGLVIFLPISIAIPGLFLIGYFFGDIVRPYVDKIRRWIYAKITGVDVE